MGQVINDISSENSIRSSLAIFILLFTSSALLSGLQSYLLSRAGSDIILELRRKLVSHLIRSDTQMHDRLRSGDLLSRVSADTAILRASLTTAPIEAIFGVLIILGAAVLMLFIDWVLLLVVLLTMVIPAALLFYFLPKIREANKDAQDSVGRMTASLERALRAIRTVKASKAERREIDDVAGEAKIARDAGVRMARLNASIDPALDLSMQGAFVLTLAVGGVRLATGAITVSELVPFLLYLVFLIGPVSQLSTFFSELQTGIAAAQRVSGIFTLPTTSINEMEKASFSVSSEDKAGDKNPLVEFNSVSFGYGEKPVLHDISFEVCKNTKTALIGPSGAGKSTIFNLLEKFYDTYSGSVSLDGEDLRSLPVGNVRNSVGYVEQESPIMAGSVLSNLLYTNPDATEEELERVMSLTNLEPVVKRLPRGVHSEVGDSGVMLSGGERQRIAIARTLLAYPRLLMLDEATSQLDAENEAALGRSISRITEECTVMMIAHRLSTIADADQIIYLENGSVQDVGTHQRLVSSNAAYRKFAEKQLQIE